MTTSGSAIGETTKRMENPSISAFQTPENKPVHAVVDTVFISNRSNLLPIASSEITRRKYEGYRNHLKLSINREVDLTPTKKKHITDSPQKDGVFGSQMRRARGYREMRGFREMESENQFFEDSEIVADSRVLRVFPNPAIDWIAIYLPASVSVNQILLHDMTGTVIKEWKSGDHFIEPGLIKITTENISPGTYMLRIIGSNIALQPIRVLIKK